PEGAVDRADGPTGVQLPRHTGGRVGAGGGGGLPGGGPKVQPGVRGVGPGHGGGAGAPRRAGPASYPQRPDGVNEGFGVWGGVPVRPRRGGSPRGGADLPA